MFLFVRNKIWIRVDFKNEEILIIEREEVMRVLGGLSLFSDVYVSEVEFVIFYVFVVSWDY